MTKLFSDAQQEDNKIEDKRNKTCHRFTIYLFQLKIQLRTRN